MRTSFPVTAILSTLLALVVPGTSAQAQQMRSYHCIATYVAPGASHITIYVSQIFPMEMNQRVTLSGAWATYIKTNYHLQTISSMSCQPLSSNAVMQEKILAAEETSWKNQGWDVVRVTWPPGQTAAPASAASLYSAAPGPGAEAPPPAPSTAPSATTQGPEPSASYCFSDDRKSTIYFSDAFDTAGLPSSSAWSNAFSKLLARKYGYKGTVTCKTVTTIVSAQSAMRDQRDALQGKQLVDTDWSYEPPAPAAAP
jgi:hypothetical protein